MNQETVRSRSIGLVIVLMLLGVAARLLPHPANVTPLTAIALFGATWLAGAWSIGLPLAIIMLSDLLLGLHETILFTWSGVALTAAIGLWLRRKPSAGRIACASLAGSTSFFLLTNFGVWLVGAHGTMYPKTLEGLAGCYVAALPFFRNALIGDLAATFGLFGLYALATKRAPIPSTVSASR